METTLFDYEEYDILDTLILQYYDCTLKVDIGRFKAGDKIDCIVMNCDEGKITLCLSTVEFTYNLSFNIDNESERIQEN